MIITTVEYELKGETNEKLSSEEDAAYVPDGRVFHAINLSHADFAHLVENLDGIFQIVKKPTESIFESDSLPSAILDAIEHGAW